VRLSWSESYWRRLVTWPVGIWTVGTKSRFARTDRIIRRKDKRECHGYFESAKCDFKVEGKQGTVKMD